MQISCVTLGPRTEGPWTSGRGRAELWGGGGYPEKRWEGWIYWLSRRADLKLFTAYLNVHNMLNPYKVAKLKSFERFLRYMDMDYHLDPSKQTKMHEFIRHFCSIGS
jgi:hypothetical protein